MADVATSAARINAADNTKNKKMSTCSCVRIFLKFALQATLAILLPHTLTLHLADPIHLQSSMIDNMQPEIKKLCFTLNALSTAHFR